MLEWPRSALTPPPARPTLPMQQLQDGGGADDLRAKAVLRPSDRINDGGDFFHVAIFADRGEQVGGFEELVFRNAGDALDHLGRIALVLLLQQLIDAARMLQREIECGLRGQSWWRRRRAAGRGGGVFSGGVAATGLPARSPPSS